MVVLKPANDCLSGCVGERVGASQVVSLPKVGSIVLLPAARTILSLSRLQDLSVISSLYQDRIWNVSSAHKKCDAPQGAIFAPALTTSRTQIHDLGIRGVRGSRRALDNLYPLAIELCHETRKLKHYPWKETRHCAFPSVQIR